MVREIVAYATARGVRVLPELDLPGHSVGLQRGAPAVYANCSSPSKLPDPTTEDFFTFLESIVAEMGTLFPDNYIHMGGDEVSMIQIIQGQRFCGAMTLFFLLNVRTDDHLPRQARVEHNNDAYFGLRRERCCVVASVLFLLLR